MNNYTMKKYFGALCNAHYIAYNELKRLKKVDETLRENCGSIDEIMDNFFERNFWVQKLVHSMSLIAHILSEFNKKENSLIITNKEEAITLIGYFGNYPLEGFNAINTKEVFPTDDHLFF